jgi:signal transduction histidine kinase
VRLSTQVLLFQLGILAVVCAAGLGLMALLLRQDLIHEYKQRAAGIARSVAADERYAAAVKAGDPSHEVQVAAEAVRRRTKALFVVVTDRRGTRYSHPNPGLVGKPVSADQPQALNGREVMLFGPSAIGNSARAKVPLRDASGRIVGEVIVAISADQIDDRLFDLLRKAAAFLGIALAVGAAGAYGLTRRVKRQTLGLEPAGLRLLWEQQAALRRVATLVARDCAPAEVFAGVTAEVAGLLGAQATILVRYESDGTASVVAAGGELGAAIPVGTRSTYEGDSIAAAVRAGRRPAQMGMIEGASGPFATQLRQFGLRAAVGAPVIVESTLWGVMLAGWTEPLVVSAGTEAHIAEFTELVGTAIANATSRTELTASRARIVAAGDEIRRRIERDLHDGAQQRLVTIGMELRGAESETPPELTELKAQLTRAGAGLTQALQDLQEISRGIHPAVLSHGGLVPALKGLARRSAVPVELELELGVRGRFSQQIEVAVYYVVAEALTNAAKHAQASVVRVELHEEKGTLELSIRDDGIGGADARNGSGLIGLADRVAALGGRIEIASPAGEGTSLVATIPIDTL